MHLSLQTGVPDQESALGYRIHALIIFHIVYRTGVPFTVPNRDNALGYRVHALFISKRCTRSGPGTSEFQTGSTELQTGVRYEKT